MEPRKSISVRLYSDEALTSCLFDDLVNDMALAMPSVGFREGFLVIVNEDTGQVLYEDLTPVSLMPPELWHMLMWGIHLDLNWCKRLKTFLSTTDWLPVADFFRSVEGYCNEVQRTMNPNYFWQDTHGTLHLKSDGFSASFTASLIVLKRSTMLVGGQRHTVSAKNKALFVSIHDRIREERATFAYQLCGDSRADPALKVVPAYGNVDITGKLGSTLRSHVKTLLGEDVAFAAFGGA